MSSPNITPEEIARLCAKAADDKKAIDVRILDVRDIVTFTDYFVICSGSSDPQLKAIANGIIQTVRAEGDTKPHATDGAPASQWVIVDYVHVLVHIFHDSKRDFYGLEDLWSDAPVLDWQAK